MGTKHVPLILCLLTCSLGIQSLFSQLQLPDIFTDQMVLQRDRPIRFWGKAIPGDTVAIRFYGETKKVVAHRDSTWAATFKKRKADSSGQEILFRAKGEQIVLKDVLLGDIWLCLGQSNMEWPLAKEQFFEQESANTDREHLRFFNPSFAGMNVMGRTYNDSIKKRLDPEDFFEGIWQTSDSTTAKAMSAVGYYFGKKILESENLPIGLIDLAMGGAPLETFISRSALEGDPRFSAKVHGDWLLNDHLPIAARNRGLKDTEGAQGIPRDDLGPNHAFKPGFAFSAGIEPLLNLPIKGVIWYQGECNSHDRERVMEYAGLLQLLVETYRQGWGRPKLPFYWVQLSATDTLHYKSHLWPEFRDQQRLALSMIDHGGMAVSSDIGKRNNVHPPNKRDVGHRLARWALKEVYGHKIVPSGPLVKGAVHKKDRLIVTFEYGKGLAPTGSKEIMGFSVDGKNPIGAYVEKDAIVIPVSGKPEFLFYAWKPWTQANLINAQGLPASTFKIKVE